MSLECKQPAGWLPPWTNARSDNVCAECGQTLLRRLCDVSFAGGYKSFTWSHKHTHHCVSCQHLPCFVNGCIDRATVRVPDSIRVAWPRAPVLTTDHDIALCATHALQHRRFRHWQNGLKLACLAWVGLTVLLYYRSFDHQLLSIVTTLITFTVPIGIGWKMRSAKMWRNPRLRTTVTLIDKAGEEFRSSDSESI